MSNSLPPNTDLTNANLGRTAEDHTAEDHTGDDRTGDDHTVESTSVVANEQGSCSPLPDAARATRTLRTQVIRHVVASAAIMIGLYALAYYPWGPDSFAGKQLRNYLELVAVVSAATLRLLGEFVSTDGATVSGRFSYVIVVDCAALDVQALFAAAVLAFPSKWSTRLIGLVGGIVAIFGINIVRLVALYFVGVRSTQLFKMLHEEVFVFVIVGLVCGVFMLWARWAMAHTRLSLVAAPEAG